ncbi:N-acetylmuramoyl-L-alanine amidase [Candidatus Dojkabacteria bacterium]|uniref:N-acetylmuramoyl-L-alanine amidase n=1 Tax=Candidatus Dojkabacteria bacterium TaxID=2099670 RepID=A0A3M0Z104_9BACT|nr:MAG: N-acetylmuramoyl-L-alanine amidase [Candidatus Dojkabacteria bacterium]
MPRLLISAAHTKESPGSVYGDLREADLTRKILSLTIPHLGKLGVNFVSVPLDLPLVQRIEWINKQGFSVENGDIFLEIHINEGGKRGIESWFRSEEDPNNRSQKLAKHVSKYLADKFKWQDLGCKSEYEHELGSLLILNQINIPGTAVEILFIDNEEDVKILKDEKKLDEIAEALAESVNDFLKNNQTVTNEEIEFFNKKNSLEDQNDVFFDDFDSDLDDFFSSSIAGATGANDYTSKTNKSQNILPSLPHSFKNYGASGSNLLDRDQRKEMIVEYYKKILGREPTQIELNKNLNSGVSKEELIEKLLNLEEFKEMQKKASKHDELFKELQSKDNKLSKINKEMEDATKVIENLNKLLRLKNSSILKMQKELKEAGIITEGEYYDSERVKKKREKNAKDLTQKGKKGFIDSIIDFLKL